VDEAERRVQFVDARVLQAGKRAARHEKGSGMGGVDFWIIEYYICIANKLHSHAFFQQQSIPFSQVQPPPPPPQLMHYMGHGSAEVCQTLSIIARFILFLFISLNLVTSS
jgi:hypothetical protein